MTPNEGLTLVALSAVFCALVGWSHYLDYLRDKLDAERRIEHLKDRLAGLEAENPIRNVTATEDRMLRAAMFRFGRVVKGHHEEATTTSP